MDLLSNSRINPWIFITGIFLLFAGLASATTWYIFSTTPWLLDTDQLQFGNGIYKALHPEWYSRDFVFQSDFLFGFYTPSFMQIALFGTKLTNNYVQALALTQFPMILAYFIAGYIFYYVLTKSEVIALIFTLLGVTGFSAFNSQWDMVGLEWMLARTFALPTLTLSLFWFLKIFRDVSMDISPRTWFILGFLIGLTANFHPTTGMTLAISVGTFTLLYNLKTGKPGWLCLLMLIIGTLLGAILVVIHVVGGSNLADSSITKSLSSDDFRDFARLLEWRIRSYPFIQDFGRGWTAGTTNLQFLIRAPWIILSITSWMLARPQQHSRAILAFFAVQWLYIWLVVDNIDVFTLTVIISYTLYKWLKKDDRFILVIYELIAVVLMVGVFLPLIVRPFWLEFEIWSISTIVVELSRGLKQIHLPLTLLMALAARDFWNYIRYESTLNVWQRFLLFTSLIIGGTIAMIAILSNIVSTALSSTIFRDAKYQKPFTYLVTGVNIFIALYVTLQLLSVAMTEKRYHILLIYRPDHLTVLAGIAVSLLIWSILRWRSQTTQWSELVFLALGLGIIGILQLGAITSQPYKLKTDYTYELANWAKSNTDIDDLFLFYWNRNTDDDEHATSTFRLFSNRNLDFSHKDLNLVAYAWSEMLNDQVARYRHYLYAVTIPDTSVFFDILRSDQVDYVVFDKRTPPEFDYGLAVEYENKQYIVYSVPASLKTN